MPQFMINKELATGATVTITDDDAHHIKDVLRLLPGNWLVISNGKGESFKAEISAIDKKTVTAKIIKKLPAIKKNELTLAQAVIKHDRTEFIIQKAVELGCTRIIPFTSERTIPKFSKEASAKKIDRWNKIAIEAAKQCGQSFLPKVEKIISFDEMVKNAKQEQKIIFYEGERNGSGDCRAEFILSNVEGLAMTTTQTNQQTNKPTNQHTNTLITVGPEGGFAESEIELAKEHGFKTASLGPLILRVETATIAGITLVQNQLGYFSQ